MIERKISCNDSKEPKNIHALMKRVYQIKWPKVPEMRLELTDGSDENGYTEKRIKDIEYSVLGVALFSAARLSGDKKFHGKEPFTLLSDPLRNRWCFYISGEIISITWDENIGCFYNIDSPLFKIKLS